MEYVVGETRHARTVDLGMLHLAARQYAELQAEESVRGILDVFFRIPVLETLTLRIQATVQPETRQLSYDCGVITSLRAVPTQMLLPRPEDGKLTDVVSEFIRRGGEGDLQFVGFLSGYLAYHWPAFDDRAGLFDAVGRFAIRRSDIECLLQPGAKVDLRKLWRAITRGESYAAALVQRETAAA